MQFLAKAFFVWMLSAGSLCQETEGQGKGVGEVIEANGKKKEAIAQTHQKGLGKIKLGAFGLQGKGKKNQPKFHRYVDQTELNGEGGDFILKGRQNGKNSDSDEEEKGDGYGEMKFIFFGEEKKFQNGKGKQREGCQYPKNRGKLLFREHKGEEKREKERDRGGDPNQIGKGLQEAFSIREGDFKFGDHSLVRKPAPIKKSKEKHCKGKEQRKGHQEGEGFFQKGASFGINFFYYRRFLGESQDFGIVCQWHSKVQSSKKRRKQS